MADKIFQRKISENFGRKNLSTEILSIYSLNVIRSLFSIIRELKISHHISRLPFLSFSLDLREGPTGKMNIVRLNGFFH